MIHFEFHGGFVNAALGRLPGAVDATEKDVLEEVGISLLSDVRIHFETLSRGGSSHGVKWRELSDSRERQKASRGGWKGGKDDVPPSSQINVDTGLLRNSSTPGFAHAGGGNVMDITHHQVIVGYGREYAEYVDDIRPLIPETAPKEWIEECEVIVKEWAEELIREAMNGQ